MTKTKIFLTNLGDVKLCEKNFWKVEFQGDSRGATVKLFYDGDFIEL